MSGQVHKIIEQHSPLEIIIDHQLSWKPHIDYVCGKAIKLIGFLVVTGDRAGKLLIGICNI